MKQNYYYLEDKTKIDVFLQIPKVLFSDERFKDMNLLSKLIYSLYLNRYVNTKYRDDKGPYIIYSDTDVTHLLHVSRSIVIKRRKELQSAGLIDFKKSVGNNKIYLYSYTIPNADKDNIFFYENELDTWNFYRFPMRLFEEEYSNLPLKSKFIYTMYFDTMCLSQMNYFVDDKERIYFQESYIDQEMKSNLSNTTIRKYREILKACHLLFEYMPFSQKTRYYLLKLDMFEDNVKEYQSLQKEEKKKYIKKITEEFKADFINKDKPKKRELEFINQSLKKLNISHKDMISIIEENQNKKLALDTFRKYLYGKRNMPQVIYDFLMSYLNEELIKVGHSLQETTQSEKEIGQSIRENQQFYEESIVSGTTYPQKIHMDVGQQVSDIPQDFDNIFTNKKQSDSKIKNIANDKKATNIININKEKVYSTDLLFINLMNELIYHTYNSIYLNDNEKEFAVACFEKLKQFKKFYISKDKLLIDTKELLTLFEPLKNSLTLNNKLFSILDKIRNSHYHFKTPDNQINCMITFLINDLKESKDTFPSWFNQIKTAGDEMKRQSILLEANQQLSDIPDSIKDYNWWEEE